MSSSAGIHQRAPALKMLLTDLLSPNFEFQVVTCAEPIVCADLRSLSLPSNPVPNQISAVGGSVEIAIVEIEEGAIQFFRWFVVARAAIEGIN